MTNTQQPDTLIAIGGYDDWDRGPLDALGRVIWVKDPLDAPEDARAAARVVAFKGHAPFGQAAFDALPNLEMIANYGVGYDAIDVAIAAQRNIRVTNTPGVLNDDVADLAVAMLIAQSRNMVAGHQLVASGDWPKGNLPLNRKVSGGVAGIMGLGRIGRDIAERLAAFKMDIHYHARAPKDTPGWSYHADPVALAQAVDYLIVALVGGPETEKYVSKEVIAALGSDGIIVNISRGSTIDEEAMLDALETGGLRGAALDVFVGEPQVNPRFLTLSNVHLQPHQGSGTIETRKAMGQLQRDNISAFLQGKPLLTQVV